MQQSKVIDAQLLGITNSAKRMKYLVYLAQVQETYKEVNRYSCAVE